MPLSHPQELPNSFLPPILQQTCIYISRGDRQMA
uniref:Uncharacterized protein n=1 Tax=Rhizophora mucronata TaxID=61149 RepID=A0A2P2JE10_RHIMU